ncbi:exocyst complex component 3-like protein [Varanus komodoensis]|uniref:exocyst complex component 3-like protein n=1 Tax=Varanus komodoensis TaxID=61221 RepID=UPI001CF77A08|nr:exocyst complex component 3-like protein [Varanus komodoensis]
MGMSAEESKSSSQKDGEWPEVEKAEKLARGAALKWASGVFYQPEKLEGLGQYRIREIQRNSSIQSRIKSTVQTYLEGVSMGLEQLHSALADVQHVQRELESVQQDLESSINSFQSLQRLREVAVEHAQLGLVVQTLPQLFSVHQLISETFDLLQHQHLLEAHRRLMDLESLQDSILCQLHQHNLLSSLHLASVESYFGGLLELDNALAQHLWNIVARGIKLVSEDPCLFVSALRIIEREEALDAALLLRSQALGFLPPGRPKCWRQKFFQVIQETVLASHFQPLPSSAQDRVLATHLASLQSSILAELCIVKDLMVQCCPPHYDILAAFATMFHQGLINHLHHILTLDLDKQDVFALLHWAIHVYPSSEMMAHPSLLPEVDSSFLGPLFPVDTVDYLEELYLGKVQASIAEWMQKMLELEFKEWFSGQEPELDYQGCFQTSLPIIAMKMLDENIRVACLVSDTLQQKVLHMALGELETFLGSLYEELVEFGKAHQKEHTASKFYTPYLLSTLNNCLAFSTSISALSTSGTSPLESTKMPLSVDITLERVQKKACSLLLEEMLVDLQPLFVQLPSRQWLSDESQLMSSICQVINKHAKGFRRTRKPISMYLLSETEHLIMGQYVRALLQKRMVCRNAEERSQMARQMLQDRAQLEELFCTLGLEENKQCLRVIADLQELIGLKDTSMLSLEVLGFVTKYPDISDDHISMLLDLRGDISKEIRNNVLEVMVQNPQVLPENYDPVFSNILVPATEPPFCLGKSKCA